MTLPINPDRPATRRNLLAAAGLAAIATTGAGPASPSSRPRRGPTGAYNVRDFGALGDGRKDDTAPIQSAIQAALADGGGSVLIPAGVYSTRTLTIPSKVHIAGAGIEATILKLRDGTDSDLFRTENHAALTGTDSTAGAFNWSLRDLTLDGNRPRNAGAGCGLRLYGWGFLLADLRIRQFAGAGISSEWSREDPVWSVDGLETPGDSMEAQVVNLKVHHCGAGGILWRGPHDTQFLNVVVYDVKTVGIHLHSGPRFSATGCQLVNCHCWGSNAHGYKIEAGYVTLDNCVAEWAGSAQLLVADDDATIASCRFFGNPKAQNVGIEIGLPDRPVYGTLVDARMADLAGGAFKFTNEGGSGQLRALIYQKTGVPYTGTPSRGTRLDLLVNGIDTGSATWLPRGPLGWNGGTPILKHLSATADWSPKPLAPNASAWTTVPVPGALPGHTIAVGYSKPLPPGVLLSGVISDDDHVAITLLNATGKPLRIPPGTLRADCWAH